MTSRTPSIRCATRSKVPSCNVRRTMDGGYRRYYLFAGRQSTYSILNDGRVLRRQSSEWEMIGQNGEDRGIASSFSLRCLERMQLKFNMPASAIEHRRRSSCNSPMKEKAN